MSRDEFISEMRRLLAENNGQGGMSDLARVLRHVDAAGESVRLAWEAISERDRWYPEEWEDLNPLLCSATVKLAEARGRLQFAEEHAARRTSQPAAKRKRKQRRK